MRKVTVILVVLIVGALAASPTSSATLRQRVATLEAKMSCLKRVGVAHFVGFAWYENDGSVHVLQDTTYFTDSDFALATTQAAGGSAEYHFLVLRNTATCRRRFGVVANPYARMAAAQRAAMVGRMVRLRRTF